MDFKKELNDLHEMMRTMESLVDEKQRLWEEIAALRKETAELRAK